MLTYADKYSDKKNIKHLKTGLLVKICDGSPRLGVLAAGERGAVGTIVRCTRTSTLTEVL
jgi:hypothetical protein